MSDAPGRKETPAPSDPRRGRLVVLSGPSGVGKSRIRQGLIRRTAARFSVSATTRSPRPDEVDGRDYQFVDRQAFEAMVAENRLLEWAEVFGNYYGTPLGPVQEALAAGQTLLLEIDVQGALQVHKRMPEATFVLVVPPAAGALQERLRGRGTENEEALQLRLDAAEAELAAARGSNVYDYEVLNDDLETAIGEVVAIVNRQG